MHQMPTYIPRESVHNDRIKQVIDSHRPCVEAYRPVPGRYGARYIDWIGCAYGYYFAIETKRPKKYATGIQYDKLKRIERALGATFEINSQAHIDYFAQWLGWCKANPLKIPNWPTVPDREAA